MAFPQRALNSRRPADETVAGVATEWVGKQGDKEPDACAAMTTAERIEMVWPITVTAVPEPSTLVLLGIGGAVAYWAARCRR